MTEPSHPLSRNGGKHSQLKYFHHFFLSLDTTTTHLVMVASSRRKKDLCMPISLFSPPSLPPSLSPHFPPSFSLSLPSSPSLYPLQTNSPFQIDFSSILPYSASSFSDSASKVYVLVSVKRGINNTQLKKTPPHSIQQQEDKTLHMQLQCYTTRSLFISST